jgi:murein tripeptide amidase MpaA
LTFQGCGQEENDDEKLPKEIQTPGENVNYAAYTQHEALTKFLSLLERISPYLQVKTAGRTLPADQYGAKDLPLCVVTKEGVSSPGRLSRNKPTFYIVAAKHGNEQSAKEAALVLIRDLCAGPLTHLLDEINVPVLPAANPYENWFDQRQNEQNLDLNRDQVKSVVPAEYDYLPPEKLEVEKNPLKSLSVKEISLFRVLSLQPI